MLLWNKLMALFRTRAYREINKHINPIDMVDYAFEVHKQHLTSLKMALVNLVATQKEVQGYKDKLLDNIQIYETEIKKCVQVNREDLAKSVIETKLRSENELQNVNKQLTSISAQVEEMATRVTTLTARTKELESKKEILKAQYQANIAMIQIQKSISGLYDNAVDFAGALKELQDKTNSIGFKISAIDDLTRDGIITNNIEEIDRRDFRVNRAVIDAELEKYKSGQREEVTVVQS